MATNSSTDAGSGKIIVTGIPANISSDKLTIYFQKRRNVGGGDVRSITFPVSNAQKDTAIITFEEPETVESVLRYAHKIGGSSVTVRKVQPKPKIFEVVTARLSKYVVQKLSENGDDLDDKISEIMDCTGAVIKPEGQEYTVKGELYELQAVFAKLETFVFDDADGSSLIPKTEYMSKSFMNPPESPTTPAPAPRQAPKKHEDVSITLDKDMFAYMQMNHSEDLNAIKIAYDVDFKVTEIGEAAQIDIKSNAGKSDPNNAKEKLKDFYDNVSKSVGQDVVEISPKMSSDKLDEIFKELRPEFPRVHMNRLYSSPNQVMFTASDTQKCKMIVDIFKSYLVGVVLPTKTDSGKSTEISVDKDIVGYIKLNKRSNMERIWIECGVKIDQEILEDCMKIRLRKNEDSTRHFDPVKAKAEFLQLYKQISDNSIQKTYDTKKIKGTLTTSKCVDAIRMASQVYKDVFVTPMVGEYSNLILFIASDKTKCEKAIQLVDEILNEDHEK